MSETIDTPTVEKRKKTSTEVFEYTGKELTGLHEAPALWMQVLSDAGGKMTRDECAAALELRMKSIKTTQSVDRLLYYWKRSLVDGGHLIVTKNGKVVVFKAKQVAETPAAETPTSDAAPATAVEGTVTEVTST